MRQVRGSDTVARLGGDEFIVLLPGADVEQALESARQLVEALSVRYAAASLPLSASVGVAAYPGSARTLPDLVQRADAALYEAKRLGKKLAVAAS